MSLLCCRFVFRQVSRRTDNSEQIGKMLDIFPLIVLRIGVELAASDPCDSGAGYRLT